MWVTVEAVEFVNGGTNGLVVAWPDMDEGTVYDDDDRDGLVVSIGEGAVGTDADEGEVMDGAL